MEQALQYVTLTLTYKDYLSDVLFVLWKVSRLIDVHLIRCLQNANKIKFNKEEEISCVRLLGC